MLTALFIVTGVTTHATGYGSIYILSDLFECVDICKFEAWKFLISIEVFFKKVRLVLLKLILNMNCISWRWLFMQKNKLCYFEDFMVHFHYQIMHWAYEISFYISQKAFLLVRVSCEDDQEKIFLNITRFSFYIMSSIIKTSNVRAKNTRKYSLSTATFVFNSHANDMDHDTFILFKRERERERKRDVWHSVLLKFIRLKFTISMEN